MRKGEKMGTLMKCGCVNQGVIYGTDKPVCLIHDCYEPADNSPKLEGRTAKCTYFGKTKPNRRYANDGCNYNCHGKSKCECNNIPSSLDLPFFEYKPDEAQDEFYCGCFGWD